MNALIRPSHCATLLIPLAACFCGLRCTSAPADLRGSLREARRGQELDHLQRVTKCRREGKDQVVQELIAGRCSLNEALGQLQELDREWLESVHRECPNLPELWEVCRAIYVNKERSYRFLIGTLEGVRSREAAALLRRLKRDYERLRAGRQTPSTGPTERTERNR